MFFFFLSRFAYSPPTFVPVAMLRHLANEENEYEKENSDCCDSAVYGSL